MRRLLPPCTHLRTPDVCRVRVLLHAIAASYLRTGTAWLCAARRCRGGDSLSRGILPDCVKRCFGLSQRTCRDSSVNNRGSTEVSRSIARTIPRAPSRALDLRENRHRGWHFVHRRRRTCAERRQPRPNPAVGTRAPGDGIIAVLPVERLYRIRERRYDLEDRAVDATVRRGHRICSLC